MVTAEKFRVAEQCGIIETLKIDSGDEVEIYLPERPQLRIPFDNDFCHYKPSGWVRIDGLWCPLGYKLVTAKMESLGLRSNPNIMKFPVGKWVEEQDKLIPTDIDWGGIWTALRKGSLSTLKKHCMDTWGMKTKGFLTAVYNPVYANSYRVKSEAVMMLKEIKL